MCIEAHIWRSEDNLREPVLSVHHVGPQDQTQHFHLLSHCFHFLKDGIVAQAGLKLKGILLPQPLECQVTLISCKSGEQ